MIFKKPKLSMSVCHLCAVPPEARRGQWATGAIVSPFIMGGRN